MTWIKKMIAIAFAITPKPYGTKIHKEKYEDKDSEFK